ncbi:MAG: hypothetical protein MPJ22_07740 [Pirellulales bacterium]|nr:hypothetical protein [Pirellulales bacterium]
MTSMYPMTTITIEAGDGDPWFLFHYALNTIRWMGIETSDPISRMKRAGNYDELLDVVRSYTPVHVFDGIAPRWHRVPVPPWFGPGWTGRTDRPDGRQESRESKESQPGKESKESQSGKEFLNL